MHDCMCACRLSGSYDEAVPLGTLFFASSTFGVLSAKTSPIDPTELPQLVHISALEKFPVMLCCVVFDPGVFRSIT